ncbi:TonB family protein [Porphyromonas pogonae]|uniref:energy transducer TonB n=1 Tax=Porphyromonas pogonae TaxID=867595 RepID=UPI002E79CDF8|nr:TonB family protein [Porphyromonas pogonae]
MEIKKSPQANLENQKGLSFLLGLVVALAIVFVSLEARTSDAADKIDKKALDISDIDDALVIQDQKQEEPEPEPEPQQKVEVTLPDEFKVMDNSVKVEKVALVSTDERDKLPPPAPVMAPKKTEENLEQIFEIVEENPEFVGGTAKMYKWMKDNLNYPEIAQENNVQGKVIVRFVVERDGSISNVEVARGVDPQLDKEAMRMVKAMPKWKPGMQQGKAVRARFTLPVVFKLNS